MLIWGVEVAKNADPGKYVYSGYGTGFDSRSEFSLRDGSKGKLFLELIWACLYILIIRENIS